VKCNEAAVVFAPRRRSIAEKCCCSPGLTDAHCTLLTVVGAPAGIRTPNQQIMRRGKGHQQGETKRDNPVFTESAAVKVSYVWSRISTPSRHNRAILPSIMDSVFIPSGRASLIKAVTPVERQEMLF